MSETTKRIVNAYLRANKQDRIVMCAIIIMIAEDIKEDIALVNGVINGTMNRNEVLDRLYVKYYPIVQERFARGALI